MRFIVLLAILLLAQLYRRTPSKPPWQACFTPGQDCTGMVVQEIATAQQQILVQA
jgi:hypothetical protein